MQLCQGLRQRLEAGLIVHVGGLPRGTVEEFSDQIATLRIRRQHPTGKSGVRSGGVQHGLASAIHSKIRTEGLM